MLTIDELVALLPLNYRLAAVTARSALDRRVIVVVANVTEAATGTVLSGNSTVNVTSLKYSLIFLDITPSSFKPGLNVTVYVRICQRLLRTVVGNGC